jgi:serine/threonine-protein kinase
VRAAGRSGNRHILALVLGPYTLSRVIGSGSMGTLYESVDPRTGRRVAIKTVPRDPDCLAALRVEIEAARRLSHPGIVAVYDSGDGYVVMEYVEGQTLRQCFDQRVYIGVPPALDIMSQLLEALQYAHDRGVWHRDINPANILVTNTGQVKIADFGIARLASAAGETIMGTPGYIAPETYLTDAFDHRVDVFAAGAVCYQLLAGVPAFVGSAQDIMVKVCHEAPAPPSVAAATTALRRFDAVVLRALARNPDERFASAAGFREALREARLPSP